MTVANATNRQLHLIFELFDRSVKERLRSSRHIAVLNEPITSRRLLLRRALSFSISSRCLGATSFWISRTNTNDSNVKSRPSKSSINAVARNAKSTREVWNPCSDSRSRMCVDENTWRSGAISSGGAPLRMDSSHARRKISQRRIISRSSL